MAKAAPADMAAGRAGGTVTVIRSRDLSINSDVSAPYFIRTGTVKQNPIIPTIAIAATKTRESL
jgi:hypothetical protein